MSSKTKICKFYVKGNCKDGNNCKFLHERDICKNFFFDGKCTRENCKFKHISTLNNNEQNKNEQQLDK